MKDKELIYLWRTEGVEYAKLELIKRHYANVCAYADKITGKYIGSDKFRDKGEFNSMLYLNLINTIKKFDIKQVKFNFGQAICTIAFTELSKNFRKENSLKNKILKSALSLDDNSLYSNNTKDISYEYDYAADFEINFKREKLNTFLLNENKTIKKIIYLKSKGYRTEQISKMMKISIKNISNTFTNFVKRFRREMKKNDNLQ
ncbi:MAG: hypothetical protein LBD05_02100 [Mycoplasmataceae bacterium]|jgi:hypothetical protein|nr:hypothetical protein [Mycoplasmataceae bacterium]